MNVKSILLLIRNHPILAINIALYIVLPCFLSPMQFISIQMILESISIAHDNMTVDTEMLTVAILLIIGIQLFISSRSTIENLINIEIEHLLTSYIMPAILDKELNLSYDILEASSTQDLIKRMSSRPYKKIGGNILAWIQFLQCVFSLAGLFVYLFLISNWLSLSFVFIIACFSISNFLFTKCINAVVIHQCPEERMLDYYGKLVTERKSINELFLFGSIKEIIRRYKTLVQELYHIRLKTTMKGQIWLGISYILLTIWIAVITFWSIQACINSAISIGLMMSLIVASMDAGDLGVAVGDSFNQVLLTQKDVSAFSLFMKLPEREDKNMSIASKHSEPFIKIKNISYRYPNSEEYTIRDLSVDINSKERVALVGQNGAGKSTLVKLIVGLILPEKGDIFINGVNTKDLNKYLRSTLFSVVFQEFGRYPITVRENIALGDLDKLNDDETIKNILSLLGDTTLINFLDSTLGKHNIDDLELSGGQWQRIALARALISSNKFIILDEPTSAMDPIAEGKMYDNILSVLRKNGVILVSHRMASARLSDRILVLQNGTIVEDGSHDQLIKRKGLYYDLYDSQAKWYYKGV